MWQTIGPRFDFWFDLSPNVQLGQHMVCNQMQFGNQNCLDTYERLV
jgi:hypothetical protein